MSGVGIMPMISPGALKPFPTMNGLAATSSAGQGNVTMNLPAGIVAGELLMCVFADVTAIGAPTTTSAGWTRALTGQGGNNLHWLAIFTKIATASNTLVIDRGVNTAICAGHVFRIGGAVGVGYSGIVNTGTGNLAQCPSLTPAWGNKNTLWAAFTSLRATNTYVSAAPAGYSQMATMSQPSVGGPAVGIAFLAKKAATETPGPTTYAANANPDWGAITIGFNPG